MIMNSVGSEAAKPGDLAARARDALAQPGTKPAIEFGKTIRDWAWIAHIANSLDEAMRQGRLELGESVGFIPRNRPTTIAALLGQVAAGRNLVMAYPYQSPDALAANIERLDVRAVIAAAEDFTPPVVAAARRKGVLGLALDEDAGVTRVATLEAATAPPSAPMPGEASFYILSSGTTGPPKHHRMPYRLMARQLALAEARPRDRGAAPALLYYPLPNISGLMSVLPAMLVGGYALLLDRFSVQAWRDYIVRYRPVQTGLPPAAFQMILEAQVPPKDLASVKFVGTGSSFLDPSVWRAFEARYGARILNSYGATEFAGTAVSMSPALLDKWGDRKFGSVGLPIDGGQVRIVDPETFAILSVGEVGLIEVFLPDVNEDWIRTSDLGMIDEDGFLFHRGRSDGAIMRGGFKILPNVVEEALTLHPAVAAACVVPLPDERLGEAPAAAVELLAGSPIPKPDELKEHLRRHVYATHMPVMIEVMDALPRTPSLKINRAAVLELLREKAGLKRSANQPAT